jgi:cell division protein FtsI/penicillin-binding protein 2
MVQNTITEKTATDSENFLKELRSLIGIRQAITEYLTETKRNIATLEAKLQAEPVETLSKPRGQQRESMRNKILSRHKNYPKETVEEIAKAIYPSGTDLAKKTGYVFQVIKKA